MRIFKASKSKVNGNTAPDEFLNTLIDVIKSLPDSVFEVNANYDIFSVMREKTGRLTDIKSRRAWLAEGLRCLGSLESSYDWLEGRDPGASNTSLSTQECGIFQCSANFLVHGKELQKLFTAHTGLAYANTAQVMRAFIKQTKLDHEFAVEFMVRLCRIRVDTHGPLVRKEINKWLSKESAAEIASFLDSVPDVEVHVGTPPRPSNYDEVYRIFGNPREASWSNKNLDFCAVNIPSFPMVHSRNARGFYCNKLLVGVFSKVFAEIIQKKLDIYDFSGCYNLRNISGSSNLSLHSWAIAIDINYDGNELGDTTPAMDKRIVDIFIKNGFFWGGNYHNRKDPMHFEWFSR
jgi:hypothetical protein